MGDADSSHSPRFRAEDRRAGGFGRKLPQIWFSVLELQDTETSTKGKEFSKWH